MATTTIPDPRALMTSLLNTLFTSSPPLPQAKSQVQAPQIQPQTHTTINPLATLPAPQRALLTTLHVLFPPPMLLQALDLLDRGLVTRLVLSSHESEGGDVLGSGRDEAEGWKGGGEESGLVSSVRPPQADVHLPLPLPLPLQVGAESKKEEKTEREKRKQNIIHLVRSSQQSSSSKSRNSRFRDTSSSGPGMVYTVRLQAWNCSCAAFAFGAFPSTLSSSTPWRDLEDDEDFASVTTSHGDGHGNGGKRAKEEQEWEFGGMSLDGKDAGGIGDGGEGGVPICKHLLACLLGERWESVLGPYVKEKVVGRGEMAGWGAGE